jgi:cyclopropane-fatty-acyl-phospholipid synthase
VSLHFKRPLAEWNTLLFGHIRLLESYFNQWIDIEGDLPRALRAGMENGVAKPNLLVEWRNRWHEFRFSNRSLDQAKANARFHYGHGGSSSATGSTIL